MSEIIFEVVKILVMVAALIISTYLIPWIKEKIGAEKLAAIEKWANYAVLMVQQVHWDYAGTDKKALVTKFLKELLIQKNVSISDEQLNILIEAAVKQMKIAESSGLTLETADVPDEDIETIVAATIERLNITSKVVEE